MADRKDKAVVAALFLIAALLAYGEYRAWMNRRMLNARGEIQMTLYDSLRRAGLLTADEVRRVESLKGSGEYRR